MTSWRSSFEMRVVEQGQDIVLGAGEEVVDADDVVTFGQTAVAQRCEPRKPAPPVTAIRLTVVVHEFLLRRNLSLAVLRSVLPRIRHDAFMLTRVYIVQGRVQGPAQVFDPGQHVMAGCLVMDVLDQDEDCRNSAPFPSSRDRSGCSIFRSPLPLNHDSKRPVLLLPGIGDRGYLCLCPRCGAEQPSPAWLIRHGHRGCIQNQLGKINAQGRPGPGTVPATSHRWYGRWRWQPGD